MNWNIWPIVRQDAIRKNYGTEEEGLDIATGGPLAEKPAQVAWYRVEKCVKKIYASGLCKAVAKTS